VPKRRTIHTPRPLDDGGIFERFVLDLFSTSALSAQLSEITRDVSYVFSAGLAMMQRPFTVPPFDRMEGRNAPYCNLGGMIFFGSVA